MRERIGCGGKRSEPLDSETVIPAWIDTQKIEGPTDCIAATGRPRTIHPCVKNPLTFGKLPRCRGASHAFILRRRIVSVCYLSHAARPICESVVISCVAEEALYS